MNATAPGRRQRSLGLSLPAILGLALLATPRVVAHDLAIVEEGSLVNLVLAVVPLVVWMTVTVIARVPHPFVTLLVIGACYGLFLAGLHQLLWDRAFAGSPPAVGGTFSGLDLGARQMIARLAAAMSSVFTGVAVGAVVGLVAWAITAVLDRHRAD
jgi:hypothetical protein